MADFSREKKEGEREIKLSFGTLFIPQSTAKGTPPMKEVVTDVGEGDMFSSVPVKEEGGYTAVGWSGTKPVSYVGTVVGQLSFDEVCAAMVRGAQERGYEWTARQTDLLRSAAAKGPRTIVLGR